MKTSSKNFWLYYIESTNDTVIAKVLAWLKLRHEGCRPKRKGIVVGKCSKPIAKVEYRDENYYRPWNENDFYAYIDCDEDDDEEEQEDENERCDIEFRPDDLEFDELNDNFEESPFSFD